MLVSRRNESASLIVTFYNSFGAWAEIFGDEITAARWSTDSPTTAKSSS